MSTLTIIPEDANGQTGEFRMSLAMNAMVEMKSLKDPERLVSAHISFEEEKFRLKVHPNLPAHWVAVEVHTIREHVADLTIVRASFRVEIPSSDDLIWVEAGGEPPRIVAPIGDGARRERFRTGAGVEYPLTLAGYNVVDGRPVYTD